MFQIWTETQFIINKQKVLLLFHFLVRTGLVLNMVKVHRHIPSVVFLPSFFRFFRSAFFERSVSGDKRIRKRKKRETGGRGRSKDLKW